MPPGAMRSGGASWLPAGGAGRAGGEGGEEPGPARGLPSPRRDSPGLCHPHTAEARRARPAAFPLSPPLLSAVLALCRRLRGRDQRQLGHLLRDILAHLQERGPALHPRGPVPLFHRRLMAAAGGSRSTG